MRSTIEIPEGLTIFKDALGSELGWEFEAECMAVLEEARVNGIPRNNKGDGIEDSVYSYILPVEQLTNFKAIGKVLQIIGRTRGYYATFNRQTPNSAGVFHDDHKAEHPFVLVQASDNGLFEYSADDLTEDELKEGAKSIPVNSGDIIVQQNPDLLHRGKNSSNHDRYNMGVWRPRRAITLDEAIAESRAQEWH